VQALRLSLHRAFGFIPWARMLQALFPSLNVRFANEADPTLAESGLAKGDQVKLFLPLSRATFHPQF